MAFKRKRYDFKDDADHFAYHHLGLKMGENLIQKIYDKGFLIEMFDSESSDDDSKRKIIDKVLNYLIEEENFEKQEAIKQINNLLNFLTSKSLATAEYI